MAKPRVVTAKHEGFGSLLCDGCDRNVPIAVEVGAGAYLCGPCLAEAFGLAFRVDMAGDWRIKG